MICPEHNRTHLAELSFPSREGAAAAERSLIVLYVQRGVASVRSRTSNFVLEERHLTVLTSSRDTVVRSAEHTDLLTIRVHESRLGGYVGDFTATDGHVVRPGTPAGRLLMGLLDGLPRDADIMPTLCSGEIARHLLGMLAVMLSAAREDRREDVEREGLLASAKRYIESHLAAVDLNPQVVADAQNVSTRTLYRLFGESGQTVGGWIRHRRLENTRLDLGDPTFQHLSVSAIGARWGLWDASHFCKIFKSTYGVTPGMYRAAPWDESVSVAPHAEALVT